MDESVGNVEITLTVNSSTVPGAIRKVKSQLSDYGLTVTKVDQNVKRLEATTATASRHGVQNWMASSAAIRVLEGNVTNNIRAAERFLTQSKALSRVLQTAFPAIGAIALMGVFARLISKVDEFVVKMQTADKKAVASYQSITQSIQLANDQLQRSNDKLDIQIAKFEHKPINNLKLAIDDARISADKLFAALDKDSQAIQRMFKENEPGLLGVLLGGKASTGSIEGIASSYKFSQSSLAFEKSQALQGATTPQQKTSITAKYEALMKENSDSAIAQARAFMEASTRISTVMTGISAGLGMNMPGTDNTAALADAQAFINRIRGRETNTRLQAANDQKTQIVATHERASRDRSSPYTMDDLRASEAAIREQAKQAAQFYELLNGKNGPVASVEAKGTIKANEPALHASGRETVGYLKSLNDGITQRAGAKEAMDAQQNSMDLATGKISKLAFAQTEAARHAAAYRRELKQLQEQLEQIADDPSLSVLERKTLTQKVKNARAQVTTQGQMQSGRDNQQILSQTGFGGANDALMLFAQRATNASRAMADFTMNTLRGLNQAIVGASMGQKGTFRQFGKSFEASGMNTMLQGAEGYGIKGVNSLLGSHFTNGKLGTASNPMYVKLAEKAAAMGKSLLGDVPAAFHHLFGGGGGGAAAAKGPASRISAALSGAGSLNTSISSVSALLPYTSGMDGGSGSGSDTTGTKRGGINTGFLSGLGSMAGLMKSALSIGSILGFADGGVPPTNRPSIVGERGPELFLPGTSGRIIPNGALGGGGTTNIHIDARGTNAAMVHSSVAKAMQVTYGASSRTIPAQAADHARRRPR